MKKLFHLWMMVALLLAGGGAMVSCSDYDDSDVWGSIGDLENRVAALEKWQKSVNEQIGAMQAMVEALEGSLYVTKVTPIEGGFTISFSDGSSYTIKNGEKGADGAKGQDGKTPEIGVKEEGGVYYWTVNGEFLTDASGKKMPVTGEKGADGEKGKDGDKGADGEKGADGVTPQLRIESATGYWQISTDKGQSWDYVLDDQGEKVKATGADGAPGKDGDSLFEKVDYDEAAGTVTITLADGTEFTLTINSDLAIYFASVGRASAEVQLNVSEADFSALLVEIKENDANTEIVTRAGDKKFAVVLPDELPGVARIDFLAAVNGLLEVTLVKTDGTTATVATLVEFAPLVKLSAEVTGPWAAQATVEMTDDCTKYAIAAFPTTSTTDMNDGWDYYGEVQEDGTTRFADAAEMSFETFASQWGMLSYMVYTESKTITNDWFMYNDWDNDGEWNAPQGLRINDAVAEYTIAVYAVDAEGAGAVYTTTFKPQPFAVGSDQAPVIAKTKNVQAAATATITAEGADHLFYGFSNTLSAAPTAQQIKAMYISNEMDTYYVAYDEAVTLDFDKYGSNDYIVWAVAIADGQISAIASETFEAVEDDVQFDYNSYINKVTPVKQTATESFSFEVETINAEKVRAYAINKSVWEGTSSEDAKPMTIDQLKSIMSQRTGGTQYSEVAVSDNKAVVELVVPSGNRPASDATTGNDYWEYNGTGFDYLGGEDMVVVFVAVTNGKEGKSLSGLHQLMGNFDRSMLLDVTDEPVIDTYYTAAKKSELGESTGPGGGEGGGEEQPTDGYWKQNLTGNYLDWLELKDATPWFGNFDVTITWKENADGYADVKGVYALSVAVESGAYSTATVISKVKDIFANYDPSNPHASVTSGDVLAMGWGANAKKQFAPNPPQEWEGETAMVFTQENKGGYVFVSVLVDNDGYLTMKTAAYLYGDSTSAETKYVDLTEAAKE